MTSAEKKRIDAFYSCSAKKSASLNPSDIITEGQVCIDIALAEIDRLEKLISEGVEVWLCSPESSGAIIICMSKPDSITRYAVIYEDEMEFNAKHEIEFIRTGVFSKAYFPTVNVKPGECVKARIVRGE